MAIIPVLDWQPDNADLGNPGSIQVVNALPGRNSYKPFPQHSALTGALTARARGAIDARDRSQNVYQYAGDATKLYNLSGTTWNDVSRSSGGVYTTGAEERWEFVVWKDKILATNYSDDPQSIAMGGANFAAFTTALRARHIFVVGDHVVLANTFDGTDGDVADRVRWSAFEDETDFTVSPVTGSDFRDLKGGPIQRGFGGEFGVLFSLEHTYRMDPVGSPTFFRINQTIPEIGLIGPGAGARIGSQIFIWSNRGMQVITNGTGHQPIGEGRVDQFLKTDLDDGYLHRISAVSDPGSGRVFWAYPGSGNVDGRPNKIVCYDTTNNKWGFAEIETELLWQAGGVSFTLEQLDSFASSIDDLLVSLDSSQWKGDGNVLLAAFDTDFKHGFFQGSPMTATIETRESEIRAGKRSELQAFRPLVDMGSFTAQVGTRNTLNEDVTWSPVLSPTSTGRITKRSNARYHRFRFFPTGEWKDALGVQVDRQDIRDVGLRG